MYFTVQAEKEEAAEMVDLGLLTDDQLKAKLLQYGVKAGPILGQSVEVTVVWLLKQFMQYNNLVLRVCVCLFVWSSVY